MFLKYLVLTAGVLAFLTLVGWPLSLALRVKGSAIVPAPILGMCVLPLFAWHWLHFTGWGLKGGVISLTVAFAIINAVLLYRRRPSLRLRGWLVRSVSVIVAVGALCAV